MTSNKYKQYEIDEVYEDIRYLQLLSQSFPSIATASTEIINLEAILNLPKGTEHFLSDLHGEHEAFRHVLKNASGTIKRKVDEIFGNNLRKNEKKELCTLIYYPNRKLELVKKIETEMDDWYRTTLIQLVRVCQSVSSKYTRSKVRKALPADFSYIIQELLHESSAEPNKQEYINVVVNTIISTHRSDQFIVALCHLIHQLSIDTLHIVGDIYDRGPGAHIIMDTLCNYHNFDIQWGNHDIVWMGAAAGNRCCIANVLRMSMRYDNMTTLEDGYGINLLPLATFAMDAYADDDCVGFAPKQNKDTYTSSEKTRRLIAKMHKAISIIQFKLEGQTIKRHPEFKMEDRLLLDKLDLKKGALCLNGKEYPLSTTFFPTIDVNAPYELTKEEQELMDKLHHSFEISDKLRRHMHCLYANGSLYTICNSNLLFHASIPMNKDGSLKEVEINGRSFKGKRLLDEVDYLVRCAAQESACLSEDKKFALDYIWYLWCGKDSPFFDKNKMSTFERYFIKDKSLHKEKKGFYYLLQTEESTCDMLLDEFGVEGEHKHIINGHVPVKAILGEKPIKANGKLMIIDGGFSRAYQPETGIAGYTLVYHSRGMQLVQHEPFTSTEKAIEQGLDIKSTTFVVELNRQRLRVRDTDIGKELLIQIKNLKKLLIAYRIGALKER
jgi:fructose-1,6-bisphosphatase-3